MSGRETPPRLVIGIAGGSGSGKTTVARAVIDPFDAHQVQILDQDSYYRDNSDIPFEERTRINYDHPDAFDQDLLVAHILALRSGRSIEVPVYDYARHTRSDESRRLDPAPVLVVEGLMVLMMRRVRELLDVKIYVDTPADIRFIRRLQRDTRERGRSAESVVEQYLSTVRPMHEAFVEASKGYADVIFPEGYNNNALAMLSAKIAQHLGAPALHSDA